MKCDYLIVGAGLAGATCAFLLQAAGARVVLVERANAATKRKLCGGMLTARSVALVDTLFGERGSALYQHASTSMHLITDGFQTDIPHVTLRTLDRPRLDNLALENYLALGGMLVDQAKGWRVDLPARRARVETPHGTLVADYGTLVGADGALSQVRRLLTGVTPAQAAACKRPLVNASLEAACEPCGLPITLQFDPVLYGYCWYIPSGEQANIGCMAGKPRANLRARLDAFAASLNLEYTNLRGAFLPSGAGVLLEQQGVYLLGDAAGLICPPSGEGIYFALESALQLACALARGGATYQQRMHPCVHEVRRQYVQRHLVLNSRMQKTAGALARAVPGAETGLYSFALNRYAGFSG
ncbi:MAG: NAD(P)/FAD-dependent oxidoreductase [Coriobacteriia bacterium]|nr:NAD(P)/FAD-dependent oxidoreductase [Coriobacteriia bacterium]